MYAKNGQEIENSMDEHENELKFRPAGFKWGCRGRSRLTVTSLTLPSQESFILQDPDDEEVIEPLAEEPFVDDYLDCLAIGNAPRCWGRERIFPTNYSVCIHSPVNSKILPIPQGSRVSSAHTVASSRHQGGDLKAQFKGKRQRLLERFSTTKRAFDEFLRTIRELKKLRCWRGNMEDVELPRAKFCDFLAQHFADMPSEAAGSKWAKMKLGMACLRWFLLLAVGQSAPVLKKVISMLQSMKETGENEMHEEEVQYAAFSSWCDGEIATKTREAGESGDEIQLLQASIESGEAAVAAHEEKLQGVLAEMAKWNATMARTKETTIYKETHQDYTESIQAIMKASRSLKAHRQAEAVSLLTKLPPAAVRKVAAFLALQQKGRTGAPELDSLEFSSDRIEDMLNELRDKFTDERSKLEKEEMTLHHAHQSLMQELTTMISQAEAEQQDLTQRKASEQQGLGANRAGLADAEASEKEMKTYLEEVTQNCAKKAKDFKERRKLREGELSAIDKAVDLLSSEEGTALVSLRLPGDAQPALRAAEYLQNQAVKFNSRVLFSMATRLSSNADPMASVRTMLNNLITTLEKESSEEMEHRDWCENEMSANEKAREDRTSSVETLKTQVDSAESLVAKLGAEITELESQLSENQERLRGERSGISKFPRISKDFPDISREFQFSQITATNIAFERESLANQTEARKLEKSENEKTVADAKSAEEAVAKAIEVLRNFYANSFVQTGTMTSRLAAAPKVFDGAYSPSGGDAVIAMLEVVQSDYSKLETTTASQEMSAQKDFDNLKSEMAILKVQQEKDVEHKKAQKGEKEQEIVGKHADLQNADKELTAAMEYYEQLKDSCLSTGSTAMERAARRTEEIQSLKEAMDLLETGTPQ
eukprot:s1388_g20.t1